MMLAKVESKTDDDPGNSSSRRFLHDIEQVSKRLNLHRKSLDYVDAPNHHRSKSSDNTEDLIHKDKKSSIWKKPWKALSHIRNRRFDCWFFLHVHSVERLPSEFDDTHIRVYWKRKHEEIRTRPAKVSQGKAQFEETLMHRCSVYGSKSGHHHSAKYEPKVFLLYALVVEATMVDMGKHRIDLTKLLPLTLEELEDKKSSGKWTSSFKLTGSAKGGMLIVSFGFSVRGDHFLELGNSSIIPKLLRESKSNIRAEAVDVARDRESGRLQTIGSSASNSKHYLVIQSQSLDSNLLRENKLNITDAAVDVVCNSGSGRLRRVGSSASSSKRFVLVQSQSSDSKVVNDLVPIRGSDLAGSICLVYENLDKANMERSHTTSFEDVGNNCTDTNSTVAEQEIKTTSKVSLILGADQTSRIESIELKEIFEDDGMTVGEDKGCYLRDEDSCDNEGHAATGDTKHEGNGMESIDVKDNSEDDETAADGWTGFNPMGEDYCNNDDHHVTGIIRYQGNDTCNKVLMLENSNIEIIDVKEIFKDDDIAVDGKLVFNSMEEAYPKKDHSIIGFTKYVEHDASTKGLTIGNIDPGNLNLSVTELGDPESLKDNNERGIDIHVNSRPRIISRSLSLDDITDSVANDFLRGLAMEENPIDQGADSDPESPRGLLLRHFEEEALASGDFILNDDFEEENVGIGGGDLKLSLVIRVDDKEDGINKFAQSLRIKKDAELLEYTETKALMKEWGFNENVFQNSPGSSSGGFGSPVYLPVEEPMEFPPLGEGLGSTIRTKDGGFLRSMNPLIFKNAKNGGKLIMQVSAPVVLPAAMGSSIMEILQLWASVGYEKMYMQVDELMPLEDISGKMLHQVAWEITSRSEATERLPYLQQESEDGHGFTDLNSKVKHTPFSWGCEDMPSTFLCDGVDIDYVSFEGLAPLAMDKIETMSIEGMRIQSGVANDEAPSSIEPQPLGETSAFLGNSVTAYGSPVLENTDESEAKDRADDLDELLSFSLKLDEWMRFDAGVFDDEDGMSEKTCKIMEAHLVGNMEFDSLTLIQDKSTGKSCGLLGNNFTVALRVQLRDPLRDFETVGTSMISLVEVERVFLDPKPIIHCKVSDEDDDEGNYAIFDQVTKETNSEEKQTIMQEATPLFKITEVHVAGFSIDPVRKQNQGALSQEHSGLRWLLASGMGEMKNLIHSKTNAIVKRSYSQDSIKTRPTCTLWSISSHVHSPEAKWKELATMNVHIRNPDVIFIN